ncbi:MAG: hypothetical protein ACD_79C00961G0001 [uncultured bacterium]|nr:MAG: hypothetical protein ACD_79C00961G0001 [uncultured bacterium]
MLQKPGQMKYYLMRLEETELKRFIIIHTDVRNWAIAQVKHLMEFLQMEIIWFRLICPLHKQESLCNNHGKAPHISMRIIPLSQVMLKLWLKEARQLHLIIK